MLASSRCLSGVLREFARDFCCEILGEYVISCSPECYLRALLYSSSQLVFRVKTYLNEVGLNV